MCLTSDSIACEQNHWIFGFIFSAVIEDVITHPLKCDFLLIILLSCLKCVYFDGVLINVA